MTSILTRTNRQAFYIVGLGELLWDLLPTGRHLGGAPANFAYMCTLLGNRGIVASRVGDDALGHDAIEQLGALDVSTRHIQIDARHPTATVGVEVDPAGQPRFEIHEHVAWDFLEWTPEWRKLASEADAVCFGSLAQRGTVSRATIQNFLAHVSARCVRVFDVNLRQAFYSDEILMESMKLAHIVKLNDEELPRIMELFGTVHRDEITSAAFLRQQFELKLVCVTRGARGSLLVSGESQHEHPGFRVKVADTIGAGDAFTAGLVCEYLSGASWTTIHETANRVGAWVASHAGGMPRPQSGLRADLPNLGQDVGG